MRNAIVVGEQLDPTGIQIIFTEVFWIPVNNATQQVPIVGTFNSAVPLASASTSAKWTADGATGPEMAALQAGTVREFIQQITLPLGGFTDALAALQVDAYFRYYNAKVNGGSGTIPTAVIPSSLAYVGASGVVVSTTIAAASNGAALPQGTITVASTTGFPASGTIFVPASQSSGPQSGQIVVQAVAYTGTTATTFTGCTGGTGGMFLGGVVNGQVFTAGA